ncbi:MAG: GntR family transcriptional regulator [Deltaproteobacteria bacterium]|nr:GntR family transcriptional regulator [Deltaproteobacteria bacterium]
MKRTPIIKPIETISQQVFKILEEEILSGRYKPGDRLIEREIAERLGISRIPVREALLSLERWGLVVPTGANRKGREVIGINRREIAENYSIKEFIESYALGEKSLQRDKGFLAILGRFIREMEKEVEKGNLENYRKLNSRFHHEIAKSLNNRKLYQIFADADKRTRWFQNLTLYSLRMERSILEHKLLLEACETINLRQIRDTVKNHYGQAVDFLLQKLVPSTSSKPERPKEENRGKRKISLPHLKAKGVNQKVAGVQKLQDGVE